MRVLHILNDVTDRGNGIVNTAVDLAIEQVRQGLEVAVASAGGGYLPLLERAGVVHLFLDQSRNPMQLLRAIWRFRSHLRHFSRRWCMPTCEPDWFWLASGNASIALHW